MWAPRSSRRAKPLSRRKGICEPSHLTRSKGTFHLARAVLRWLEPKRQLGLLFVWHRAQRGNRLLLIAYHQRPGRQSL